MNDGGSAFPVPDCGHGGAFCVGMALRDYFAAKAPMPNAAEASGILGWQCRESVVRPSSTDHNPEYQEWLKLPSFDELWKGLKNSERLSVCAKFQFMYADAMLAERAKATA